MEFCRPRSFDLPRFRGSVLRKLKKPMTHDCTRFVMGLMCPHGTDQCRRGGVRSQPPPSRHGRRVGAAHPHPVPTRRRFDAGRGCVDAQERANLGRAALVRRGVLTRTGMRQHGGVLTQVRPNRQRPRSDTARPGPTCAGRIERGGAALTCIECAHTGCQDRPGVVDALAHNSLSLSKDGGPVVNRFSYLVPSKPDSHIQN